MAGVRRLTILGIIVSMVAWCLSSREAFGKGSLGHQAIFLVSLLMACSTIIRGMADLGDSTRSDGLLV